MGCCPSKPSDAPALTTPVQPLPFGSPPPWRHDGPKPLTAAGLARLREEFWATASTYGGVGIIWQALRAATEADLPTARLILEAACVTVPGADLSTAYDERGFLYELPLFLLSAPTNLAEEPPN